MRTLYLLRTEEVKEFQRIKSENKAKWNKNNDEYERKYFTQFK